jgi:monoamine oxidase
MSRRCNASLLNCFLFLFPLLFSLSRKGYSVVVLEARDRIGGRVHTQRSALGYNLEIGAQWVEGKDSHAAWAWASTRGMTAVPSAETQQRYFANGAAVSSTLETTAELQYEAFETYVGNRQGGSDSSSLKVAVDGFIASKSLAGDAERVFRSHINSDIEQPVGKQGEKYNARRWPHSFP